MRVPGIPYVQGVNSYSDQDGQKYGMAIHNTSNDASDSGEASYATWRPDGTSSHLYADSDSVTQSLDTARKAGHAGSTQGNENAIATEITGGNGMSRAWWLANVAWNLLGQVHAAIIRHHWPDGSFQVRRASVAEMRTNPKVKAYYGHDDMRLAWGGTTHNDPGPNFPWDRLFAAVNAALGNSGGPAAIKEDDMIHWFASAGDAYPGKLWFGSLQSRRLVDANYRLAVINTTALGEGLGSVKVGTDGKPFVRGNPDGMGPEILTVDQVRAAVREVVEEEDGIELDAEDVAARVDAKLAARLAS